MARKFLYIVALLIVLTLGALTVLRYWAGDLSTLAFVPTAPFEELQPLESGAYADPGMWLARPGLGADDASRFLPEGAAMEKTSLGAAVFFVHSTSYFDKGRWNAPLGDKEAREQAQAFVRDMASPFNRSADIWAPRYRQATVGAFLTDSPDADRALDAAYSDVLMAFERFVATIDPDRPIVLAGHSQGAFHLRRLIAERIGKSPVKKRIAAAYLVGWPISLAHDIPKMGLAACTGPDKPGCVVSWQTFAEPAETASVQKGGAMRGWLDGTQGDGRPFLCSNPLDGMAGGAAAADTNRGTLLREEDGGEATLAAGMVQARCNDEGILLIGDPPDLGHWVLPGNNYHVYDIPLFWADLRRDVAERVEAWKATH